jgi:hypothetical protein
MKVDCMLSDMGSDIVAKYYRERLYRAAKVRLVRAATKFPPSIPALQAYTLEVRRV